MSFPDFYSLFIYTNYNLECVNHDLIFNSLQSNEKRLSHLIPPVAHHNKIRKMVASDTSFPDAEQQEAQKGHLVDERYSEAYAITSSENILPASVFVDHNDYSLALTMGDGTGPSFYDHPQQLQAQTLQDTTPVQGALIGKGATRAKSRKKRKIKYFFEYTPQTSRLTLRGRKEFPSDIKQLIAKYAMHNRWVGYTKDRLDPGFDRCHFIAVDVLAKHLKVIVRIHKDQLKIVPEIIDRSNNELQLFAMVHRSLGNGDALTSVERKMKQAAEEATKQRPSAEQIQNLLEAFYLLRCNNVTRLFPGTVSENRSLGGKYKNARNILKRAFKTNKRVNYFTYFNLISSAIDWNFSCDESVVQEATKSFLEAFGQKTGKYIPYHFYGIDCTMPDGTDVTGCAFNTLSLTQRIVVANRVSVAISRNCSGSAWGYSRSLHHRTPDRDKSPWSRLLEKQRLMPSSPKDLVSNG